MKEIKGYEGFYSVYENGNIFGHVRGKILSSKRSDDSYLHVTLSKDGVRKNFDIHRLVAVAYIPNPENKPQVNHINGLKTDNRVENLEWVSAKENVAHCMRLGLRNTPKGKTHCFFGKPAHNRKNVINVTTGEIFESISEAAKKLNIKRECIRDCLNGRQKTAGGFSWRFEKESLESTRKTYTGERAIIKKLNSRTKEGRIEAMYFHQQRNSIRRKQNGPEYSLEQFTEYLLSQNLYHELYEKWVLSNYIPWLAPSIDRINKTKQYSFDNMKLVTFKENFDRARKKESQ